MTEKFIGMVGLLLLIATPTLADTTKESSTPTPSLEENRETTGLDSLAKILADRLKFSAFVEVEASAGKYFSEEKTSDVSLATVELGVDATITEWVSAHVLALYEEGEEDDHLIIDEGTITLGNEEKSPFHLTAGKMYVPFGSFKSAMVSDPLTLEFAEIKDTALLTGFTKAGWYGSLYAFNGEVAKTGKSDTIDTFGANLGYKLEKDDWQFDLGAGWLNNLGNTDTIRDHIAETSNTVDGFTDALALHGHVQYGGWSVVAEYVAALDHFKPGEIDFNEEGARPKAWMLELVHTMEVAEREVTLALGYQGTDEAVALGLPEHRYLASVSIGIFDKTTLALEYRHDLDYDLAQGGTDKNAHQVVAQLAVEF